MLRWLAALRKARGDLVAEALERLEGSGSTLAAHETEYLIKAGLNACLVALSQSDTAPFEETMAAIAEREARAGNALRVEAMVVGLDLLCQRVRELADLSGGGRESADAVELVETGRQRFLSVYLRAKAEEDDRRAMALESYAAAVENVPSIIYSTDQEGNITDINHLAASLLGYRKEELIGQHHSVLMRPEDAERCSYFVQERRTDDRATRRAHVAFRTADGEYRDFEVSSTGVYSADGRYVGTDGVARAVTGERLQLEYQLDDEGRFSHVSEAAATALGFRPEELIGQHFSLVMDPRERERVGRMFGERRSDDRAANRIRVALTGRDGARREFEISAAGHYDPDGRFAGTIGLGLDLTDHSELERGVAENRRKYRHVFDHAGMGLSVVSPDLVLREANTWHLRRRRRPVVGGRCHLALFGKPEPCEWCGLREALTSGEPVLRDEVISPLDGRRYSLLFAPLPGEDGRVTSVVEAVIDVTAEHERREREYGAAKLEALHRLARGLAAPLEDRLTIIALRTAAAADHPLQHAVRDAVGRLRRFGRFTGAGRASRPAGDLNAVVRAVTEGLPAAPGVDLETDLLPTIPLVALGSTDLAEVVEQLTQNALEAMPHGGTLTIETAGDREQGVTLRLTDSGEGMDEAVARQALDPFYSTRPGHEGLGLSHCAGLVRSHGGRLELSSSGGAGTAAEVWLPAAAPAAEDAGPATAPRGAQPAVTLGWQPGPLATAVAEYLAAEGFELTTSGGVWLGDAADDVPAQGPAVLVVGADGTAAPDRAGLLVLPKPFCAEELLAALTAGETA